MLQRGIETPDMDVRWVSSLSWYFLNWFGLNGLYRVILGSDNGMKTDISNPTLTKNISAAIQQQDAASSPFGGAAAAAPGQPQDYNKLFTSEAENLQLAQGIYQWVGAGIDERILHKYGKNAK